MANQNRSEDYATHWEVDDAGWPLVTLSIKNGITIAISINGDMIRPEVGKELIAMRLAALVWNFAGTIDLNEISELIKPAMKE